MTMPLSWTLPPLGPRATASASASGSIVDHQQHQQKQEQRLRGGEGEESTTDPATARRGGQIPQPPSSASPPSALTLASSNGDQSSAPTTTTNSFAASHPLISYDDLSHKSLSAAANLESAVAPTSTPSSSSATGTAAFSHIRELATRQHQQQQQKRVDRDLTEPSSGTPSKHNDTTTSARTSSSLGSSFDPPAAESPTKTTATASAIPATAARMMALSRPPAAPHTYVHQDYRHQQQHQQNASYLFPPTHRTMSAIEQGGASSIGVPIPQSSSSSSNGSRTTAHNSTTTVGDASSNTATTTTGGSVLRPRSYSRSPLSLSSYMLLQPPPAYSSSIPPGQKRLIAPGGGSGDGTEQQRRRRRRRRPRHTHGDSAGEDENDESDDGSSSTSGSSSGGRGGVLHRDDADSASSAGEEEIRRSLASRGAATTAEKGPAAAAAAAREEEEERRRSRFLNIGDRKRFAVTVRQPLGPCLPPWGPDGKGKPRFIKVTERGEQISGYVDVGPKADGGVRLEVTLAGRLTSTQYYGGQPRITDSHKFVRRTVVVWPPPGQSQGEGETIPTGSRHHWKIKLPLHADREDGTHAGDSSENDGEEGSHERAAAGYVDTSPSDAKRASSSPSSSAPMAIPKPRRFSFGRKSADPAPALSLSPPSFSSSTRPLNIGSSSKRPGLSPTALSTSASERSPSFSFGSLLTRITSREEDAMAASTSGTSPGGRGKKALVRRESSAKGGDDALAQATSADAWRSKGKEPLLPTLNIMIGDVQGEVEYELKFRLVRKGFRINEIVRAKIIYDPLPALHEGAEEVDPRNPGWTLTRLEGGEPLLPPPTKSSDAAGATSSPAASASASSTADPTRSRERGVEAEILLPQPLILRLPPVPAQEYEEQPRFPFRIHFASTSPYPLWTFASRAASNWSITVVREIRVRAHTRECTRRMELRGIWSLDRDTGEEQQIEEVLSPDSQARDGINVHLSTSPTAQGQGSYFADATPTHDHGLTPYDMVDVVEQHDIGDDAIFFEDDDDRTDESGTGPSSAVPASTHASALAARLLATSESSPLAPSDLARLREALETATPPPEFAIAEDNPNQSMPPPLPSVTLLPANQPVAPGDMLQPPPPSSSSSALSTQSTSTSTAAASTQVEHIYVQGMYKLSRSAYKTILTQFRTRDMSIRYFLEVTIEPKSGAVKQGFGKLKGRVELSVFKGARE